LMCYCCQFLTTTAVGAGNCRAVARKHCTFHWQT